MPGLRAHAVGARAGLAAQLHLHLVDPVAHGGARLPRVDQLVDREGFGAGLGRLTHQHLGKVDPGLERDLDAERARVLDERVGVELGDLIGVVRIDVTNEGRLVAAAQGTCTIVAPKTK